MATPETPQDDSAELAELAILARRAGLKLSAAQLAGIVEPYRRSQASLRALSASLDAVEEPATIFHAQ